MFTMLGQAPQSHAQYLGSRPNQGVLCARLLGKRHAHAVQSAHSSPNTNCNLQHHAQRRKLLSTGVALPLWLISIPQIAVALPLAPLGCGSDTIGGPKLQQPALKQVQDILARDLAEGQYFVTGDLTPEVFADDCRFVDPTNDVTGLSRYRKALTILFDPAHSEVRFKGIRISGPDTIEADWTLGGTLKLPWKPRIQNVEGHTVYTINSSGLVQKQEQQWSISAFEALKQSFTPSFGVVKPSH